MSTCGDYVKVCVPVHTAQDREHESLRAGVTGTYETPGFFCEFWDPTLVPMIIQQVPFSTEPSQQNSQL